MKKLSLFVLMLAFVAGCAGGLVKSRRFSPSEMAKGYGKVLCQGWAKPSGNIVGYNLYASQYAKGPFDIVNSAPITDSQYIIYGVRKHIKIYWVVTSIDKLGQEGKPSPVQHSGSVE